MKAKDIMTTRVVRSVRTSPSPGSRRSSPTTTSARFPWRKTGRHRQRRGSAAPARIGTEKPSGSWWLNLWRDPSHLADDFTKAHGKTARDVMTAPVISVGPEAPLSEIAETLERNHIKRVTIIDDGKVVGLISRANIIREIASATAVTIDTDADDEAIRGAIDRALSEQPWASYGTTSVTVKRGTVEFWGIVGSESERAASKVLAEEVKGVQGVADHRALRSRVRTVAP